MRILPQTIAVVTLLILPIVARAQRQWPLNTPKYYDALMIAEHNIALKQNSTNDYLIAMADAADVNILADATRFPASVPPLQGEWKNNFSSAANGQWSISLLSFFQEFSSERGLTWARDTDAQHTFLVWSAPGEAELASIGRELMARRPRRIAHPDRIRKKDDAEKEMDLLLANFYKEQYQWDGSSSEVAPDLKLSQLPSELRAKITALLMEQIEHVDLIDQGFWYEDVFWQHATLQIRKQFPRDNFRFLAIGGQTDPEREYSAINYGGLQAIDNPRRGTAKDPDAEAFAKAYFAKNKPTAKPKPVETAPAEIAPAPEVPGPKITLTLKQRPLAELLDEAQKQSGVTLSAAPEAADVAQTARVTLRVKAMPLAEFTAALSGLYGVRWKQSAAGGLEMQPALSPLEVKISQMGYLDMFQYWTKQPRRDDAPDNLQLPPLVNWFEEITETVDPNDLTAHAKDWAVEGVPVADLPPELAAKIRRHMEAEVALQEMQRYLKEKDRLNGLSDDTILHVAPLDTSEPGLSFASTGTGADKKFTVLKPTNLYRTAQVLAPDGRLITSLFFASTTLAKDRQRQKEFDDMNARMQELSAQYQQGKIPLGAPPPPGVLP